jgi:phytoene dehydrogenase-like protein
MLGHGVGWPIPRGGTQAISNALGALLQSLGGKIETGVEVRRLEDLPRARVVLLDVTPGRFIQIAGNKLPTRYRCRLERFRYGPAVFKIDYALKDPIPWSSEICRRAGTVHLGGTFEEVAAAERTVADGRHPKHPFVLLAQPTIFDPTRVPAASTRALQDVLQKNQI